MKKHPVDEIFRTKLTGFEKQPTAAAWDRLSQGKKSDERRLSAWIWYAAAGVVIAFMAGYAVWINQAAEINPQLASREKPVEIRTDSTGPQVTKESVFEQAKATPEKLVRHEKKRFTKGRLPGVLVKATAPVTEPAQLAIAVDPAALEPESEMPMPVVIPASEIESRHIASVETKEVNNENRTIVVRVEEPVVNEEKEKPSRFTRIFRQLKNAKQGETVDWEDVGFNPKALMARVDDRLRNKEEKVSEKFQNIKERTKL